MVRFYAVDAMVLMSEYSKVKANFVPILKKLSFDFDTFFSTTYYQSFRSSGRLQRLRTHFNILVSLSSENNYLW